MTLSLITRVTTMSIIRINRLIMLSLMLALSGAACSSGEQEITIDQVPPAITDRIQQVFPDFTAHEAERYIRDQKTIYEIEGNSSDGLEYEIEISESGTIIKIELGD